MAVVIGRVLAAGFDSGTRRCPLVERIGLIRSPGESVQHLPCSRIARPKAFPTGYHIPPHYRVRHDKIDAVGIITIRYNRRLHDIGLSTTVTVLIDDLDIRVLNKDTGTLIRKLVLDPTRDYQPRGVKCGNSPENDVAN